MKAKVSANGIVVTNLPEEQIPAADCLFDFCDAEFAARQDIHNSFEQAKGRGSWARYYLLHEVKKVAISNQIQYSYHMTYIVAYKLADIWFTEREAEAKLAKK